MTWTTELGKIRTYLRDPEGTIWNDEHLRHLYNDAQQDFQHRTKILEECVAQRVPQTYQCSYVQDWEYRFLPSDLSQFYQCLSLHDDFAFCHRWEPQQITGIEADVADYGHHFTQVWEAFAADPGEVVRMSFPSNLNAVRFIAYDETPIAATTRKAVQSCDPSHVTKEGLPQAYYLPDESSGDYVLYPRPTATDYVTGEAVAQFGSDDTEDTTTGIIAVRSATYDGDGVPYDIVDTADNVFLVYSVSPTDVVSAFDEPDFPNFLRKYIRFGVLARAYGSNTDGRIRSLAEYWAARFGMGVTLALRYVSNRRQDRDYCLTATNPVGKSRKHPRLPDGYPPV